MSVTRAEKNVTKYAHGITPIQNKKAMESTITTKEKQSGDKKVRVCISYCK